MYRSECFPADSPALKTCHFLCVFIVSLRPAPSTFQDLPFQAQRCRLHQLEAVSLRRRADMSCVAARSDDWDESGVKYFKELLSGKHTLLTPLSFRLLILLTPILYSEVALFYFDHRSSRAFVSIHSVTYSWLGNVMGVSVLYGCRSAHHDVHKTQAKFARERCHNVLQLIAVLLCRLFSCCSGQPLHS